MLPLPPRPPPPPPPSTQQPPPPPPSRPRRKPLQHRWWKRRRRRRRQPRSVGAASARDKSPHDLVTQAVDPPEELRVMRLLFWTLSALLVHGVISAAATSNHADLLLQFFHLAYSWPGSGLLAGASHRDAPLPRPLHPPRDHAALLCFPDEAIVAGILRRCSHPDALL
uniref:Uncharacterized protein n=2 Tax=Triticum urartu TaxID=4572 RepID=A0A8R7TR42_TRIUA